MFLRVVVTDLIVTGPPCLLRCLGPFAQHSVAPGFCIHRFPPAAQHTVKSHTYPLSTEQAPACWPELSGHEAQSAHMGRSEANTPGAALRQEPGGWWERLPCSQAAIAQAP